MSAPETISLLQNVYARLISTDESKLSAVLSALLPKLLMKLSSPDASIKNQVYYTKIFVDG